MNPVSLVTRPLASEGADQDARMAVAAAGRDQAANAAASAPAEAAASAAAFAQLYRRYLAPIYAYTLARTGNCEDAQDLTSQTFLAAWDGIGRYRGQSKFSTWLFGIARNRCAECFRQRRRAGAELDVDAVEETPGPGPGVAELVEQRVRFQELARRMRALSPDQAEALSLRIFGGLSAAEAGQVMGKSEAAVKMLVHRAVCELQALLGDWTEVGR